MLKQFAALVLVCLSLAAGAQGTGGSGVPGVGGAVSGSVTSTASDFGYVTLSGGVATVALTKTYASAPSCPVADASAVAPVQAYLTGSGSAWVLHINGSASDTVTYVCAGTLGSGSTGGGGTVVTTPPTGGSGTTTALSAVSLGQNANMNGFKPFCPSAQSCSTIYSDISGAAVDTTHTTAFRNYYTTNKLHPDFIDGSDTLPYYVLNTSTTSGIQYVPSHCTDNNNNLRTDYCTESDDTLIPFVSGIIQEQGTDPLTAWPLDGKDHHIAIVDQATGLLYDMYQARNVNGTEQVYSNTIWDLTQPIEGQHPQARTSADAAGLPVGLGLTVRYEDILAGHIDHALRVTLPGTGCGFYETGDCHGLYTSPASHAAGNIGTLPSPGYMGMRLRLAASFSDAGYSTTNKIIIAALKKYGFIVADNGGALFFQGTYDPRFDQNDLLNLGNITTANLEVVQGGNLATGELNPEDANGGTSKVSDQTGLDSTSSRGTTTTLTRPTITQFTASATTVALGSPVTFSAAGTNGTYGFIDFAGPIKLGGSVTVVPTQTTTYLMTLLGPGGYAKSSPITVTVTGPSAAAPTASPAAGSYTSNQTVSLASTTPSSVIHYTLDNSTPTCSSAVYSSPLSITSTKTVKAVTCASGYIPSSVASYTYAINIAGATPQVVSHVDNGTQEYQTTITLAGNFTAGNSAILSVYSRGASITAQSAACGARTGTKLMTQPSTEVADNFAGNTSMFYVSNLAGGAQNCTITLSAESQTTVASVDEISGTSGVDVSGSDNTYVADHNGFFTCGNLTTTGTNRLGIAFGAQLFATPTPFTGYTGLISTNSNAASGYISLPTAGTTTMKVASPYTDNFTCSSVALKP